MNLNKLSVYKEFIKLCQEGQEPGVLQRMVHGIVVMLISWTADMCVMERNELHQQVI